MYVFVGGWVDVVFLAWFLMLVDVWMLVGVLRVACCLLLVDVGCWLCVVCCLTCVVSWCLLLVVW